MLLDASSREYKQREGGCVVVRRGHLIAVVLTFLIGCAFLLLAVGCEGTSSETFNKKEEQGSAPEATASEEARCQGTRTIRHRYTTNDMPGCPKGGMLSGTDKRDRLDGKDGEDEVRALGGRDDLYGGSGNDILHGGPDDDYLVSGTGNDVLHGGDGGDQLDNVDAEPSHPTLIGGDDVLYGGDGDDFLSGIDEGEDVLYGGDGNDTLFANWGGGQDKLYCGEGRDTYFSDKNDYVARSCEVKARGGRVD